jgi:hypothetical protein
MEDNILQRHRRIDIDGNWEYLCVSCNIWKLKEKFKGCVDKIDGFGNCLTCRSCISHKCHITKVSNDDADVKLFMLKLGYEVDNPENPVWLQFHKKYNLPLPS